MTGTARRLAGFILSAVSLIVSPVWCRGDGLQVERDPDTGWAVYRFKQGDSEVALVPEAGFNVASWRYRGQEILRQPPRMSELRGVGYGVPILYPTPNRVRGAAFEFGGRQFKFPDNNGGNFIHGLVHSTPWQISSIRPGGPSQRVTGRLVFGEDKEPLNLFPLPHALSVTLSVTNNAIRWSYIVDNRGNQQPIPFGFALHPYFNYLSPRQATTIRIPAAHLMEARDLLPTAKLLPLDGHPLDARQPRPLSELHADDVYEGMKPNEPTEVVFTDQHLKLKLTASREFTHLVLYTPDQPFFCVENQTCSTDAHNLHAAGHKDAAHLLICPAGRQLTGFVEYSIEPTPDSPPKSDRQ